MRSMTWASAMVAFTLASSAARADVFTFIFPVEGSQQNPPVATSATGTGSVEYDSDTNVLSWTIDFSGVTATAAHFHGPADIGVNTGIQVNIGAISGLVSPMVGSSPTTDTQGGQLLAGLWYVNIHSSANSGGEIRGQVTVPTRVVAPGSITIELEEVATGLTAPNWATHAGDGSGRLFITDQTGQIRIVGASGGLLPTPFLDINGLLPTLNTFFDERGLLGLAFHPDYVNNGRFFVRYSAPRTGSGSEPCFGTSRGCHKEVLAEFSVSQNDSNIADPTPTILFEVDEPQFNHDSGGVAFGPDGFLYFTLGDGGGAHDGLADVPPSHGPIGNGQNIETHLGSILRIDVDGGAPFAVPPTNPFVGLPGLDEIYAYGMRNPFRFSFDDGPGGDGRLFLADVGQNLFEEINVVELGGNYGWVTREGFHCFNPLNPLLSPTVCAATGPSGEALLDPIAEYHHDDGIAVIGGFVYRGSQFPDLVGKYVFGDFSTDFVVPGGRLFWLDADGALADIFEFVNSSNDTPLGLFVFGFGEDEAGEVYVLASGNLGPTGNLGRVYRIIAPCDGNANSDGLVDFGDLNAVLGNWLNNYLPGTGPGDANGDGIVDFGDLNAVLGNWLTTCP